MGGHIADMGINSSLINGGHQRLAAVNKVPQKLPGGLIGVESGRQRAAAASAAAAKNGAQQGFADVLNRQVLGQDSSPFNRATTARNDKIAPVIISKHAQTRLRERNIGLTDSQMSKVAAALNIAREKGVNDALVLLDGIALVANAKSMTVVTAAGKDDLKESVFTNIDGAVFA